MKQERLHLLASVKLAKKLVFFQWKGDYGRIVSLLDRLFNCFISRLWKHSKLLLSRPISLTLQPSIVSSIVPLLQSLICHESASAPCLRHLVSVNLMKGKAWISLVLLLFWLDFPCLCSHLLLERLRAATLQVTCLNVWPANLHPFYFDSDLTIERFSPRPRLGNWRYVFKPLTKWRLVRRHPAADAKPNSGQDATTTVRAANTARSFL